MTNQLPPTQAVPKLRYQNVGDALIFLQSAFGLTILFVADEGGVIVHAQLRAGATLVFVSPDVVDDRYGMRSPRHLNGTNQCMYLVVNTDIDLHAAIARAAGAHIVTEPYDTAYGGRQYSCKDPDGHVWTIGSYNGEPNPGT